MGRKGRLTKGAKGLGMELVKEAQRSKRGVLLSFSSIKSNIFER